MLFCGFLEQRKICKKLEKWRRSGPFYDIQSKEKTVASVAITLLSFTESSCRFLVIGSVVLSNNE
jgi:hypothetical protein